MIARRMLLAGPGLALLLTRCGPAPPPPAVVDILIKAGKDQNPDASGAGEDGPDGGCGGALTIVDSRVPGPV